MYSKTIEWLIKRFGIYALMELVKKLRGPLSDAIKKYLKRK